MSESSRFKATIEGKVTVKGDRKYAIKMGSDCKLDDAVLEVVKARCTSFDVGAGAIYLYVETGRPYTGDSCDSAKVIEAALAACERELDEWLNSIEQGLDRLVELHEEKAKAVFEASDEALIAELLQRGTLVGQRLQ